MIEDMFDEEYGLISASRAYHCLDLDDGAPAQHIGYDGHMGAFRVSGPGHLREETDCARCGLGPILWDHWRYMPYVLVPFVIFEEPF